MSMDLKKRKRYLPAGWYPDNAAEIRSLVSDWTKLQNNLSAFAIVAPHAGWYFSGDLAAKAVWSLRDCDTVAILGGHLRRGDPILFAEEENFDCTVRDAANDVQVLNALNSELKDAGIQEIAPDHDIDNSVEIMLPLAALRFPEARLVWLRVPPDYKARELGSALARAASTCRKKLAVIASTDLTHYGPNYGFMPHGVGESAVDWVRNENDRGFINAVLSMDTDKVLGHARDRFSACSSGAVAAAISFSLNNGAKRGVLIGHKLSFDMHPDRSFVGYAAIAFVP
ncbi:MAG: AmmeMemoRadiSam system protein B [Rectinema sp.]